MSSSRSAASLPSPRRDHIMSGRVFKSGTWHTLLKLPRDHTDAEELEDPSAHRPVNFDIDNNPSTWKIELANRWVQHIKTDAEGREYDLSKKYIFQTLPDRYHFMSRVPSPAAKKGPMYRVIAGIAVLGLEETKKGGRKSVSKIESKTVTKVETWIWKGFDEFFPHFCWLMEQGTGACLCKFCQGTDQEEDEPDEPADK